MSKKQQLTAELNLNDFLDYNQKPSIPEMQKFFEQGGSPNAYYHGEPVLFYFQGYSTMTKDSVGFIHFLLDNDADPWITQGFYADGDNENDRDLLFYAALFRERSLIERLMGEDSTTWSTLVNKKYKSNYCGDDTIPALLTCVNNKRADIANRITIVRWFMEKYNVTMDDFTIEPFNDGKVTLAYCAASDGDLEFLRYMQEQGFPFDRIIDTYPLTVAAVDYTPAMSFVDSDGDGIERPSVRGGIHKELLRWLLEQGYPITASSVDGDTLMSRLIQMDAVDFFKEIIAKYPRALQHRNDHGSSLLFIAAAYNGVELVQFIYEQDSRQLNAMNNIGQTPLMIAAYRNAVATVQFLLSVGAARFVVDMNSLPQYCESAYEKAKYNPQVYKLLQQNDCPTCKEATTLYKRDGNPYCQNCDASYSDRVVNFKTFEDNRAALIKRLAEFEKTKWQGDYYYKSPEAWWDRYKRLFKDLHDEYF